MQKGEIIETGKHAELMKVENGAYRRLVETQKINQELDKKDKEAPSLEKRQDQEQIASAKLASETSLDRGQDPEKGNLSEVIPFSTTALVSRIATLSKYELHYIVLGTLAAALAGSVYPVFAIVFGQILEALTKTTAEEIRSATQYWCLFFVGIAVATFIGNFFQAALFGLAGEKLTTKLRHSYFGAILRQNIGYFDEERHSTGVLTSKLATEAHLVQGIMGATLGVITNVSFTVLGSLIVALVTGWELALVVMGCIPVLIASGMIRMKMISGYTAKTKEAYEHSSRVACEVVLS